MSDAEIILEREPLQVGEPIRGRVRADATPASGWVKLRVRELSEGETREWVESKSAVDEEGRFELPSPTMPSYIGARLLVEWTLTLEEGPEGGARELASTAVYCEVPPEHRAVVMSGTQDLRRHSSALLYTAVPFASVIGVFRATLDGAVGFMLFLLVISTVSIGLGLVVAWRDRSIIRQRLALETFTVEVSKATPPLLSFAITPNRDLTVSNPHLVIECYEQHHESTWSRFRNRFSRFAFPADVRWSETTPLDLPERIPGMQRFEHEVALTLSTDAPFTIRRFPGTNARWRGKLVLETEELGTIEAPFDFEVVLPRLLEADDEPARLPS